MSSYTILMKQTSHLPPHLRSKLTGSNSLRLAALWHTFSDSTKALYAKEYAFYRANSGKVQQQAATKALEIPVYLREGSIAIKNGKLIFSLPVKILSKYATHFQQLVALNEGLDETAAKDEAELMAQIIRRLPPITDKMIKALETEEANVGVVEEWETPVVKATKKKGAAKVVDVVDEVEDVVVEADEVEAAAEEAEAAEIEEEASAEAEAEVEEEEVAVVVPKVAPKNKKTAPATVVVAKSAAKPMKGAAAPVAVEPTPTPSSTKKVAAVIAAPPTLKKSATVVAAPAAAPAAKKKTTAAAPPVAAVVASPPATKKKAPAPAAAAAPVAPPATPSKKKTAAAAAPPVAPPTPAAKKATAKKPAQL